VSTEEIQKEEPAPIKAARDEQEAARQLKLAKMLAEDGKLELAKKHYREIVEKYPKTKSAEEAQRLLEREKE
jgi:TolA-binding protein